MKMRKYLVRYVEESAQNINALDKNYGYTSPHLDGIFVLTLDEKDMLDEWVGDDMVVNEKDTYYYSEDNLSIVSKDEDEISLFEQWMPNGGGFPWKKYLIDDRIDKVMEMAFENPHSHLDNITEVCNPRDIIQACLDQVDLKGGWKKLYEKYVNHFNDIVSFDIRGVLKFKENCKLSEDKAKEESIKEGERIKQYRIWFSKSREDRKNIMKDEECAKKWRTAILKQPRKTAELTITKERVRGKK